MRQTTDAATFVSKLSAVTNRCVYEFNADTCEVESDHFSLTFVIDACCFEIRSIDNRGNEGFGRRVTEVIHAFADEHGLSVIASNVRDSAQDFWRTMGYEEGSHPREFFRYI